MIINLLLALSMIFVANKSREIEKKNNILKSNLISINEDIKINKIEITTHQNNSYLKSLYSLYFSEKKQNKSPEVISLKDILNENPNIKFVNTNK